MQEVPVPVLDPGAAVGVARLLAAVVEQRLHGAVGVLAALKRQRRKIKGGGQHFELFSTYMYGGVDSDPSMCARCGLLVPGARQVYGRVVGMDMRM